MGGKAQSGMHYSASIPSLPRHLACGMLGHVSVARHFFFPLCAPLLPTDNIVHSKDEGRDSLSQSISVPSRSLSSVAPRIREALADRAEQNAGFFTAMTSSPGSFVPEDSNPDFQFSALRSQVHTVHYRHLPQLNPFHVFLRLRRRL